MTNPSRNIRTAFSRFLQPTAAPKAPESVQASGAAPKRHTALAMDNDSTCPYCGNTNMDRVKALTTEAWYCKHDRHVVPIRNELLARDSASTHSGESTGAGPANPLFV